MTIPTPRVYVDPMNDGSYRVVIDCPNWSRRFETYKTWDKVDAQKQVKKFRAFWSRNKRLMEDGKIPQDFILKSLLQANRIYGVIKLKGDDVTLFAA